MSRTFLLVQHPPQWDLPSRDFDCLVVHALLKFGEMPFAIENTNRNRRSSTGRLPLLVEGTKITEEAKPIVEYLKSIGLDLEGGITSQQQLESYSLINLIYTNYYLITQLEIDQSGRSTTLFPNGGFFRFFSLIHRWRVEDVAAGVRGISTPKERLAQAKEIFSLLSSKLGSSPYLYGNRPSTLDAFVFGYLAVTLRAPGLERLSKLLFGFPNLVEYCRRNLSTHWAITTSFTSPTSSSSSSSPSTFNPRGMWDNFAGDGRRSEGEGGEEEDEIDPLKRELLRKQTAQHLAVLGVLALAGLFVLNNKSYFEPWIERLPLPRSWQR